MIKTFKIFGIFIIALSIALSGIFITTLFSPGFREDVEIFLHIDDENAISTLKDKNAKLEEQISGYESRIETLKLQISDLESTVDKLGIEDEFLRSEIERLQARVNELEQQVENLDGNIDNLNAQIEAMNQEIDELWNIFNNLSEYENAVNNGTTAETELTESEKALLESRIAELEETVAELTDEIEELNETIEELNNQIENLENQKSDIEINKTNNDILIVDKRTEIDNFNTQINNYHVEIGNLDKSINENNIIINNLIKKQEDGELTEAEGSQLVELQNQNANFETQKYNINANLLECENRVATLQIEVDELERNNAEFERQIASIDLQINELETRVSTLENEAVNVQTNINSLQERINKFKGLINNSTIIGGSGNEEEPNNPENPPESGDLTINIQGESVLDLPLAELQSDEVIMNYFENNENFDNFMYAPIEEAGSGFENFVNGENVYLAFTIDDSIQFLMILYSDTESARGVFESFELMKDEILSERLQLISISQCGKVGLIELRRVKTEQPEQPENPPMVDDLTVTMTGTPIFELPYSELQTLAEVENYLSNNGYYFDTISAGNENMDSGMLSVFVGANHFVTAMLNNERQILGIVIYDNIDNARGIFESANVMITNMGDGVELVNSVQCGLIGVIEMQHKVCEHNGERYTDKIYVSETETQITYNVITKCSKCGDGLSSEMVTEDKETTICEHTETYVVQENYKESETMISYDNVTYCKKCDAEISRETITEQKAVCNHSGFSLRQEYLREDENYTYYNNIYICDNCGVEISREEVAIEKPCEHKETYENKEFSYEDENYTHYLLITYCSKCNVELSRDTLEEEKPSQEPQLLFANNEEQLVSALANAKDGDSIFVKDFITINNPIVIDKSITIYGSGISGSSIYVTAENVSIQGISFSGLNTENEIQESYIYALGFGGTLNITNCNFDDIDKYAIEITPVNGANILISGCNFLKGSSESVQGYINIESEEKVTCAISVTSNSFSSIDGLDTEKGKGEAVRIVNCNLENITLETNEFRGDLTVEELKSRVVVANAEPWITSESMLVDNTFTSTLAQ